MGFGKLLLEYFTFAIHLNNPSLGIAGPCAELFWGNQPTKCPGKSIDFKTQRIIIHFLSFS